MKLFFLLSDITVIILALIPSCFGVITLVVQAIINARVKRVAKKQDVIHKQIDGKMEQLLTATGAAKKAEGAKEQKEGAIEQNKMNIAAAHSQGEKEGRAQLRDEQNPETKTKPL